MTTGNTNLKTNKQTNKQERSKLTPHSVKQEEEEK